MIKAVKFPVSAEPSACLPEPAPKRVQQKADSSTPISPSRSYNMSRIRSRDTTPERIVRSLIHGWGFRYRLHSKMLPGKPDIVLVRHRKIVFVHGCFWHGHGCKVGGKGPKSNQGYWSPKLDGNRMRDRKHSRALRKAGWKVLVVWECWTRNPGKLEGILRRFLEF